MGAHEGAVFTKKIFGEVMLVPPDTIVSPRAYVAAGCGYTGDGVRWGRIYFGLTLSHVHLKHEISKNRDAEVTFGKDGDGKCLPWEQAIDVPEVREQVISAQRALAELCSFILESYKKGEVSEHSCLNFLKEKGVSFG